MADGDKRKQVTLSSFGFGKQTTCLASDSNEDTNLKKKKIVQRKIKPSWFSEFEWLEINEGLFYCRLCLDHKKKNIFTSGKSSCDPKKDDLKKHATSKDHKDALEAPKLASNFQQAAVNAHSKAEKGLTCLLRTLYVMAKENISTVKFGALTDLQIMNGCGDIADLRATYETEKTSTSSTGSQLPYHHHESVDELYQALSSVIEDEIVSNVNASPFFGIQIDEATDCSNLTTLMTYIRFLKDGHVHSRFLNLSELSGGSAKEIYETLTSMLNEKGININKMIALATDGASVMQGTKGGVTALAKAHCPYLISTHCLAHRLALASEKAARKIPYMVKYIDIVNRLGKLCKFSPKFCRSLENSKQLHNQTAGKLKQIFFTRWLTFNDTVAALVDCIESLISCLVETSQDTSHGITANAILKNVSSYKFIATTYFSADLVGILSLLCKAMQKDGLTYQAIRKQIDGATVAIQALNTVDGPYLSDLKKKIPEKLPAALPMSSNFSDFGHVISDSPKQKSEFTSLRKMFVENVVKSLSDWFPDSGILDAFSILDPTESEFSDENCSKVKLQMLVDKFGNGENALVDPVQVQFEYALVHEVLKTSEKKTLEDFYAEQILNSPSCPNLGILYAIALVSPCTSVECERGFSQYNLIKTSHRNQLSVTHVNDLSLISIEGPPLSSFDFELAFDKWVLKKDRRVLKRLKAKELSD